MLIFCLRSLLEEKELILWLIYTVERVENSVGGLNTACRKYTATVWDRWAVSE